MNEDRDVADPKKIASVRRMALESARGLLEESGAEALQLRTLAGRIGCGVSTLYHHFEDKNALLSAVAVEGFGEMEAAMRAAMASGEFARRIDGASAGYIRFMYGNLKLYALMHAESVLAANAAVREAERSAFATYRDSLRGDPLVPPEQIEELSLVGWALGRGVASMILSEGATSPQQARALAEKIFRGFGYLVSLRRARSESQA